MKNHREYYLFYPYVLCVPFIHELGHCVIAWCFGREVTGLWFTRMTYLSDGGPVVLAQSLWEYSVLLPVVFVLVWFYIVMRDYKVSCVRVFSGAGSFRIKGVGIE